MVVLTCLSLTIRNVEHFSHAFEPFLCIPLRSVYWSSLPIYLNEVICLLAIEFFEFLGHVRYQPLAKCTVD